MNVNEKNADPYFFEAGKLDLLNSEDSENGSISDLYPCVIIYSFSKCVIIGCTWRTSSK